MGLVRVAKLPQNSRFFESWGMAILDETIRKLWLETRHCFDYLPILPHVWRKVYFFKISRDSEWQINYIPRKLARLTSSWQDTNHQQQHCEKLQITAEATFFLVSSSFFLGWTFLKKVFFLNEVSRFQTDKEAPLSPNSPPTM